MTSHRSVLPSDLHEACDTFQKTLAALEKRLLQGESTIPPPEAKEEVAQAMWSLSDACERRLPSLDPDLAAAAVKLIRDQVGPWLWRSALFYRSYWKPHGYTGDYRMLELMYDLESRGDDPYQPALVNCLDYAFSTIHSVRAVWERRHWFCNFLLHEYTRNDGELEILDIACGGARYQRDFLTSVHDTRRVSLTLIDQDAAAVAYSTGCSLAPWSHAITAMGKPLRELDRYIAGRSFHVIIATGIYDYLDDPTAIAFSALLRAHLRPGGALAISNFHPEDRSRFVKTLLGDWDLIFRTEDEVRALFPGDLDVTLLRSQERSLVIALARSPQQSMLRAR